MSKWKKILIEEEWVMTTAELLPRGLSYWWDFVRFCLGYAAGRTEYRDLIRFEDDQYRDLWERTKIQTIDYDKKRSGFIELRCDE